MKALVIQGSPRAGRHTDILVDTLIQGMRKEAEDIQINKIYLRDKNISPCTACGFCELKKACSIKDDMQEIYKSIEECEIIIIASPLYFNNVTAYTKAVIDRCQIYWSSKYVLEDPIISTKEKKIGVAICTAGSSYKKQFEGLKSTLNLFFKAINTDFKYELFIGNTDKINISENPDILLKSETFGKNIVEAFKIEKDEDDLTT